MQYCEECGETRENKCYLCSLPLCELCEVTVDINHQDKAIRVDCCPDCGASLEEFHNLWMPMAIGLKCPCPNA